MMGGALRYPRAGMTALLLLGSSHPTGSSNLLVQVTSRTLVSSRLFPPQIPAATFQASHMGLAQIKEDHCTQDNTSCLGPWVCPTAGHSHPPVRTPSCVVPLLPCGSPHSHTLRTASVRVTGSGSIPAPAWGPLCRWRQLS